MSATLPGDLPGLLTEGSRVIVLRHTTADCEAEDCDGTRVQAGQVVTVTDAGDEWIVACGMTVDPCGPTWSQLASADVALDLTIPANRDRAARWLAERVGLTVGATAPRWERESSHADWGDARWVLSSDHYAEDVGDHEAFSSEAPESWRAVPGISAVTDPASALALAILAVSK